MLLFQENFQDFYNWCILLGVFLIGAETSNCKGYYKGYIYPSMLIFQKIMLKYPLPLLIGSPDLHKQPQTCYQKGPDSF